MPRRSKNAEVAVIESNIENHVAGRIRLRRGLLGMSQSDLARTLGITFQQVQKYERGSNRVSVGKLFRLAEILDVPLTFFFDGLDLPGSSSAADARSGAADEQSPVISRRELDVLRAWKTAPPLVADAIASLLRSVTPGVMAEPDEETREPLIAGVTTPAQAERAPAMVETPTPKRRGRPPKATNIEMPMNSARRRRNAVWDPSDIVRAAREKS